jgi:pyruvate ferredoxin oxidoreductase delta subunit
MFGPLVTKAGASKNNKTGSWRVESRPNFKKQSCVGCKICSQYCPEGCISGTKKDDFEVDLSFCKGCGICALVCPKKDIEMIKEEGK